MEPVKACFTDDIQDDEDGTGQANGQAWNINRMERFVFINAPDGYS